MSQASTQLQAANMSYTAIIDTVQAYDGEVTKLTADTIANKEAMKRLMQILNLLQNLIKTEKLLCLNI